MKKKDKKEKENAINLAGYSQTEILAGCDPYLRLFSRSPFFTRTYTHVKV